MLGIIDFLQRNRRYLLEEHGPYILPACAGKLIRVIGNAHIHHGDEIRPFGAQHLFHADHICEKRSQPVLLYRLFDQIEGLVRIFWAVIEFPF